MNASAWRTALRSLLAPGQRGYTLTVLLTLALTLAAVTAISRLAWVLLVGELPFANVERVVHIGERNHARNLPDYSVSEPNYRSWRDSARSFSTLAAVRGDSANLGTDGHSGAERVDAFAITGNLWETLGVPLLLGRTFNTTEQGDGAAPVVIISAGLWQRRFDADPAVLGRTLKVNDTTATIIGVARQDIGFTRHSDVWFPLAPSDAADRRGDRRLDVFGRLADGVDRNSAQAELDGITASLARQFKQTNEGWDANVVPVHAWIVGAAAQLRAWLLLAAVGLLLLVACANIAGLQVARALAKGRETAVRLALGARRGQILAQTLREQLLLGGSGAIAGLLLGAGLLQLAGGWMPASLPRSLDSAASWPAAMLATSLGILTLLAFGALAVRVQSAGTLARALTGRSAGAGGLRLHHRQLLVVVQFALATALVGAASLLAVQFAALRATPLGFRSDALLSAKLTLPEVTDDTSHAAALAQLQRLADALKQLPGVRAVGWSSEVPLGELQTGMEVFPAGADPAAAKGVQAAWRIVSGDYLETLGVAIERGRGFGAEEASNSTVLSAALVKQMYAPGDDPIGRSVYLENGQRRTVVGIAADVRQIGLADAPTPTMYFPTSWYLWPTMTLLMRSEGDPALLLPQVQQTAARVLPDYPLFGLRSMREAISEHVAQPRMQAGVFALFALGSLLLAALGLVGLMNFVVTRSAPDLALRMALGAPMAQLKRQALRRGLSWCVIGCVAGLVAVGLLTPWINVVAGSARSGADQWLILAGTAASLLLVAALACWLPVRRIARLAPSEVLRSS